MSNIRSSLRASLVAVAVLGLSACTNIESSRNVNNPDVPGRVLAVQVCATCHGRTGESTSPMFPKLAGQQKDYLIAQLTDFKGHDRTDSRGAAYMWGFTHLTTKQVNELADYFAEQVPMRGRPDAPDHYARGAMIFRTGLPEQGVVQCAACHGSAGEGNGAFPRLAGQHANYVVEQIKVFQQTDHRPRGSAMKQVTHALTDADAMEVAHYIASIGSSH